MIQCMPCKIRPWEIASLAGWLREVRAQVEKEGELTEAAMKNLCSMANPNIISKKLEKLRLRLSQNSERGG